jgi:hypothetical protein
MHPGVATVIWPLLPGRCIRFPAYDRWTSATAKEASNMHTLTTRSRRQTNLRHRLPRSLRHCVEGAAGAMLLALLPAIPAFAADPITVHHVTAGGNVVSIDLTYTCPPNTANQLMAGAQKGQPSRATAVGETTPICDNAAHRVIVPARVTRGSFSSGDVAFVLVLLRKPDGSSYASYDRYHTLEQPRLFCSSARVGTFPTREGAEATCNRDTNTNPRAEVRVKATCRQRISGITRIVQGEWVPAMRGRISRAYCAPGTEYVTEHGYELRYPSPAAD